LDIVYYQKLKIEKYCSKIVFKCVSSVVGPNFKVVFTKKVLVSSMNSVQNLQKSNANAIQTLPYYR